WYSSAGGSTIKAFAVGYTVAHGVMPGVTFGRMETRLGGYRYAAPRTRRSAAYPGKDARGTLARGRTPLRGQTTSPPVRSENGKRQESVVGGRQPAGGTGL